MEALTLAAALDVAVPQVRDDPGLRELLRAARAWGVPPSRMLARRTVDLVAELDEAGRPIRYLALPWPVEDVALALALQQVERETCEGCGQSLTETTDPDNEGRYEADRPVLCYGCTALAAGVEPYRDHRHAQALRFGVHLKAARDGARV